MKKIVSIMLAIILQLNIVLGYTVTVRIKGIDLVVTGEAGNTINVESKIEGITGWDVKKGNITITDNSFIMPEEDVEIEAIFPAAEKYPLTVESIYLTRTESKPTGEVITVETEYETSGYTFTNWTATGIILTAEQQVSPAITFTMPNNAVTLVANYREGGAFNAPVIAEGLTPVNWNGTTWVTTDEANWDYNYDIATAGHNTVEGDGTGKWANAQTSDGSMYVWIPRYTYKITSGEHQDVDSWSSVDTPGTGKIEVKFSNGTTDDTTDSYKKHPAFTFGTDELEGIWVAKYEASRNDATESSEGSGTTVSSKPGVISWRDMSVSKIYDCTYNLNRTLDSHLMRNSEWGAVAYLTNAIGKIPYINDNSNYITGSGGSRQDGSGATYAWNTVKGVKASSTHNVYGIYDLSGGSWEYVSAYYTGGDSTKLADDTSNKEYAGSLYTNRETKYVETYDISYDSNKTGDAVYETSSSSGVGLSWDGDFSAEPSKYNPVFVRGGGGGAHGSIVGVFSFYLDSLVNSVIGFRPVLAIPSTTQSYTVTFDANGGTGTMSAQTFTSGVAQNLTANTFTKDGYTFAGWSTTAGGSVEYAEGASYTATANITLYAVWTTDSYTITYNLDGGSVTGNPTTYSVTTEDITLNNPTKEGYTFKGWTGSNGTTASTTVTIAKGSTGNKTYTANWEANKYTVTFDSNGGTGTMSAQEFTYGIAQNLTTNAFTKDGYTFAGWSTTSDGSVEYLDGASYTATANVTLYAKWTVTLSTLAVGSSVYMNVDGVPKEFIVVHQGNPDSTIYDASCDGTWLLMKHIYEKRPLGSYNEWNYADTTTPAYLNNTFYNLFDDNIKNIIKTVKIPYRDEDSYTLYTGANGLEAKLFLLSTTELGMTSADSTFKYCPTNDGAKLDYFLTGTGTTAATRRSGYYNGDLEEFWTRSPETSYKSYFMVTCLPKSYGAAYADKSPGYGIRPALILPSSTSIDNFISDITTYTITVTGSDVSIGYGDSEITRSGTYTIEAGLGITIEPNSYNNVEIYLNGSSYYGAYIVNSNINITQQKEILDEGTDYEETVYKYYITT